MGKYLLVAVCVVHNTIMNSHMVLNVFPVWTDLQHHHSFLATCQITDSHGDSGDFHMEDYHLHALRIVQQIQGFITCNNLLEKMVIGCVYLFVV